ncbi:methyltransferase domain-containing protein [Microbacterium paludicola]|uniref:methyltransferase domain-containing protein n=1 Tax=Microbacterium paludicola TaxID=300019 RepID=UPI00387A2A36
MSTVTRSVRVTEESIELDPFAIRDTVTADVRFDGHRVWSVTIPYARDGVIALRWPKALRPWLDGRTRVSVHDSANGREIGAADVHFGTSEDRIEVMDSRGRWLAMTKWDRLGPVLEGRDGDIRRQLLESSRELVTLLEAADYPVYIVGGTLLGVIRDGGMMPHDDDVDLAFLCREDNPADVGLSSYRMERLLVANGYTVIRHSLAHLEITFFSETGEPDYYVDIFTGFFRDGDYCQPFALKGPEIVESDLLPTRPREVEGVELPEPNRPEAWLEFAYGPRWMVPDPTFKFVTPRSTRLRFESWFGVYNRGRVYWDKSYLERDTSEGFTDAGVSLQRFLADVPEGARVLDLGCGDGRWSVEIARTGRRVTGIDYSHEALRLAREHDVDGLVDFHRVNVNDRAALYELGARMLATGDEWYVFAHHSVQAMTKVNRAGLYRFFELVLRGEGFAEIVSDTELSPFYEHGKPSTWHLPVEWIERETRERHLDVEVVARAVRRDNGRRRPTAAVRIRRRPGSLVEATAARKRQEEENR